MPYEIATQPIQDAIVALMTASSPLTSLLSTKPTARGGGTAIYDDGDVPQDATRPYLVIGAWTQVPFHNLTPDGFGYGWNCTGQIKAVKQRGLTSQSALAGATAIMTKVVALLPHGRRLTVTGYGSAICGELNVQPAIITNVANVVTVELPAIIRVFVQDV